MKRTSTFSINSRRNKAPIRQILSGHTVYINDDFGLPRRTAKKAGMILHSLQGKLFAVGPVTIDGKTVGGCGTLVRVLRAGRNGEITRPIKDTRSKKQRVRERREMKARAAAQADAAGS